MSSSDMCGSTTATGAYSFSSNQAVPPRRPVQLSRDDFCSGSHHPVPTPHPGWSIPPKRVSVFEDDAVSPHKPTSSRRLSTGQRQRRSKQPPPPPQPQLFPDDVIKYMNMCRERYEQRNASGLATSGSSSRGVDDEKVEMRECVTILRALPGLTRADFLRAVDLFDSASNRLVFMVLDFDQDRLDWVLQKISP